MSDRRMLDNAFDGVFLIVDVNIPLVRQGKAILVTGHGGP
jgi:hypothetical protein